MHRLPIFFCRDLCIPHNLFILVGSSSLNNMSGRAKWRELKWRGGRGRRPYVLIIGFIHILNEDIKLLLLFDIGECRNRRFLCFQFGAREHDEQQHVINNLQPSGNVKRNLEPSK